MNSKLLHVIALVSVLSIAGGTADVYAQKNGSVRKKTTSKQGSKTNKGNSSSAFPGQFPESSERLLTEKDIEHRTPWGLKVMHNEIYARHGYIFKDAALRKHFRKEKWYRGKEKNLNNIKLTPIEIQNIAFLKEHKPRARH